MDTSHLKLKRVMIDADNQVVTQKKSVLPDDLPRKPTKALKLVRVSLEPRSRTKRETQGTNGHWQFDKPLCQDGQFGFIYLIHDKANNRMYIGKKQYFGTGKENKGQETNWKWYTSSCKALQEAIKANGKEHFEFYVLDEYHVRGTLGFAETWSLMFVEAPANRDKWYNMLVGKISWTVREGISAKHKARLHALISGQPVDLWSENV